MSRITLLLVDDHAVMRMGLASILGTCPELEVIGDTGDGESGIRQALKLRPDVILMDILMSGMDGIETTRRLCTQWPEAKVLALTTFGVSDALAQVCQAGARGVILKNASLKELRDAIASVADGKRYLSAEVAQIMSDMPPVPDLPPRQQEILDLILDGLSNAEIAERLGISIPVVKEHITLLFHRLGVTNRTEAVSLVLRRRILPGTDIPRASRD